MNAEVQQTHLLSSAQHEAAGLFEPQPNRLTWLNTESGGLPGFGEVTADMLQEWGFLDRFLVIREKLLHKDYQPMLADVCRRANSKYEEQSGTTYQAGVTIQPHFGPSSCQLGPISRAEDETGVKEILRELMQICSEVLLRFVPEINERGRDIRKLAKGSLIPLSKKNLFTSAQLNWTFPEKSLSSSLKKCGSLHPDKNDWPFAMTGMINFSHLPENYSQGRLYLTPFNTVMPLRPLSIYFFSARNFHCSIGNGYYLVPEHSPLRLPTTPGLISALQPSDNYPFTRLTIPIYTDTRLIEPRFQYLNPELYVWEDGGNKLYSSQLDHHNFLVSYYIVHEPEIRTRIAARNWKILINGIAAQSKGAEEKTWASRIPSQAPGSGPALLCYAFRTCEHYKIDPKTWAPRVAASFSLPGDTAPLCVYVDPATGAAMVHDPRRRRLTVAVRLTHPCYVLLSTDDQAQRVAAWSRVLASLAMTERQARIQVLESTLPDPGGAVHDFFVEHGNADDGFAAREYERLLDLAAPSSARHRTLVAVSVDLARSSRRVRAVGGGLAGAAAVLRDELTRFDAALLDCGLTSQGWLDPAELARVIRQAYDPSSDHTGAGIAVRSPLGPVAIDEHWDHIRHDAGYSAVLWISEWPRVEVAPHFLHALLFTPGIRKSISIVADGLPSGDALRQIRREKVEYLAEMQRNSRIGRITDLGADQDMPTSWPARTRWSAVTATCVSPD